MNEKAKTFSGKDAHATWDGGLCIHIGECGRAQGDLFVGGRSPWCQPDLVQIGEVAQVVERCPTGALSYQRNDGGPEEQPAAENTVHVTHNGPLYMRGELAIQGAGDDQPGLSFRAALCRCGKSANKPFCDNSHEKAAFRDFGAVGATGEPLQATGGKLDVAKLPNGPLLVTGNLSIFAASGRLAWTGTKAALCRCGQSKNKPFCDGAHKAAAFEAE